MSLLKASALSHTLQTAVRNTAFKLRHKITMRAIGSLYQPNLASSLISLIKVHRHDRFDRA